MTKYDIKALTINGGMKFELARSSAFGLSRAVLPYPEWALDMHPGVSLLKLLVENNSAEVPRRISYRRSFDSSMYGAERDGSNWPAPDVSILPSPSV